MHGVGEGGGAIKSKAHMKQACVTDVEKEGINDRLGGFIKFCICSLNDRKRSRL